MQSTMFENNLIKNLRLRMAYTDKLSAENRELLLSEN